MDYFFKKLVREGQLLKSEPELILRVVNSFFKQQRSVLVKPNAPNKFIGYFI